MTSIVLGLVFLETKARFESQAIILEVVGVTVLASVLAHEISVRPLVGVYGRRAARLGEDGPENRETADVPATHRERRRSRLAEDRDL